MIRRIISSTLALTLTLAGAGLLTVLFTSAERAKGWMFMASAFMIVLGLIWLWADFFDRSPESEV